MTKRFRKLACLMLVLILGSFAFAQRNDGTLRGEFKDQSGAALTNAKVTATNDATGVSRETTTSSVGSYNLPNLLVGTYTVKVEAPGFATYTRKNVQVNAAQVVEVTGQLSVGNESTTVDVQAGAELVNTETSQLSNTFTARAISELPIVTGANTSVLNLSIYLPNTTTAIGGTSGTGGSVGGLRGRQNGFTVDGVNNGDPQVTIASQQVIPDAVAEFNLATNHYTAEYGAASGGQFNVVTKTGGNAWKGDVWEYNISRLLKAMDNLEKASGATEPARYDFNRLGGDIGGPILRDKLFVYGAYEYQTQGSAAVPTSNTVPTVAGLQQLNTLAVNSQVRTLLAQWATAPSATGTVPVTVNGVTTNIPVGNFSATVPNFFTQHDYIVNGDLNLGKHQFRTRYMKNRRRATFYGTVPQDQFAGPSPTDNRKAAITDVWAISPRFVNDLRLSFSRLETGSTLTPVGAAYPNVEMTNDLGTQFGPASNYPQSRITNQYQIIEQQSYAAGRHSLKWGGEYRWYTSPSVFLQNSRGLYRYTNLTEFINDRVPSVQQLQGLGNGSFSGNSKNFAWFLQDDFKLSSRLTVNMGLRYEFNGNPKDANRQVLNAVATLPGVYEFKKPGNDYNNFAPRIGFAWDPTGSGKWSVRGGFGVGYDATAYNFVTNGQPPQLQAVLTAQTACAGVLAAPPSWCPAFNAGNTGVVNFLAGGAMNTTFIPPSTQALARGLTANLIADQTAPKVYNWTLGVQHELDKNTSVEVHYLGTKGTQLALQTQLNTVTAFANGAAALPTYLSLTQVPGTVAATAPSLAAFLAARARPNAAAGFVNAITTFAPKGESTYHGGSIDVNRRMANGLMFRANYTLAHTIDNSTNDLATSTINPRRSEDINDLHHERGRSVLDIRHKLASTWIYDLPKADVSNSFAKALLHGWQYSGSYILQSGQPFTPQSGVDSNGNFDTAGDRAILNPNGTVETGTKVNFVCRGAGGVTSVTITAGACAGGNANVVGYVADGPGANPNARYVQAQVGTHTNIGRNTVNSPYFNNWNMSLFKNTNITERMRLQLRMEAFDVFNQRNFTTGALDVAPVTVNTNARSTSLAVVTSPNFLNFKQFSGGARTIQFGAKVSF